MPARNRVFRFVIRTPLQLHVGENQFGAKSNVEDLATTIAREDGVAILLATNDDAPAWGDADCLSHTEHLGKDSDHDGNILAASDEVVQVISLERRWRWRWGRGAGDPVAPRRRNWRRDLV